MQYMHIFVTSYSSFCETSKWTGKTTCARLMGKMFKMLGLLPDDEVFECTPKDLITGFVGQAGHKTTEILEKSRGGVLFIDEAYQLNPSRGGTFMTEAVDELCAKITDEEFKGKLLVLLAGYDADMDEMLKVNPGLKSRFAERLEFKVLSVEATRCDYSLWRLLAATAAQHVVRAVVMRRGLHQSLCRIVKIWPPHLRHLC